MRKNLGAPCDATTKRLNKREVDEEEALLVHKAVEIEMAAIRAGKARTYSFEEVKRKLNL